MGSQLACRDARLMNPFWIAARSDDRVVLKKRGDGL
jgi:hypothetical protein